MGGKSGGGTRPVFDYHMSLDYGFCSGPVDHFNKVWVKDKSIFCGLAYARTDIEVYQPELFGGDDAEGGVVGTVEFYTGSDNQISSWELSQRPGLDPATMPGYRGIAHLFFRGLREWGTSDAEAVEAGFDPNSLSNYTLRELIGTVSRPTARLGWKWGANNPYQPSVKASVTRLSRNNVVDPYAVMWPAGGIDENGNLVGYPSVDTGPAIPDEPAPLSGNLNQTNLDTIVGDPVADVIDLYALGINQTQIDAGEVTFTPKYTATVRAYYDVIPTQTEIRLETKFHPGLPTAWGDTALPPVPGEEGLDVASGFGTPGVSYDRGDIKTTDITAPASTLTVPPGTRFIQARAGWALGTNTTYYNSLNPAPSWVVDATVGGAPAPNPEVETDAPPNDTLRDLVVGTMAVKTTPPTKLGDVIDLYELGITQEVIDAGTIKVHSFWRGVSANHVGALPDTNTQVTANVNFHAVAPVNWYDAALSLIPEEQDGRDSFNEAQLGALYAEIPATTVPPGTRYVQFRAAYTTAVGRITTLEQSQWHISYYSYGQQHCATDDTLGPLPDANPARMIWEGMTNDEWGKGEPLALMDPASFDAAAATLFTERMGMSLAWFAQESIENFIGEILDHIQAFLYQDPATGLWTLRLLRDDYDPATLRVLDETNCIAKNRKRRLWGETINEIVVSYTDPNTEKSATVSAHDLGNIAIQGGVISETRDYHGFRNKYLAQYVANRDVRAAGYPLFSCQITVDRREWDARPGDVRKFSWAEDQINEIVVRVMSVDYGKPGDRKIVLDITEDIFSIERASYGAPQGSEWQNSTALPTAPDVQVALTAPLPALIRAGATVDNLDAGYPGVAALLFADDDMARPTSIEVHSAVTKANGSSAVEKIGSITPSLSGLSVSDLPAEAQSRLPRGMVNALLPAGATEGDFLMFGLSEAESELVMLDSYDDATKEWVIARGMWDTVPVAWPANSRVWAFAVAASTADPTERAAGETVTYNLLPRTALGVLDFDDSIELTGTYSERPHAPFRPGNCQIDALGFGSLEVHAAPFPTEITATWNTRNRTTEDQVSVRWDEGNAAMEVGQTTVLRILDDTGAVHGEVTGLAGSSEVISVAQLPPGLEGHIEFLSERDGIRSVFGARRYFDIRPPVGYGLAYGLGYGGSY